MASTRDTLRSRLLQPVCAYCALLLAACSNGEQSSAGADASARADEHAIGEASASAGASETADSSENMPAVTQTAPAVASSPAPATPTLFWLDVSGRVLTSGAQDFRARTLVRSAGRGSDGIAIDVLQGHIYWTNMGVPADDDGTLMRANLDGSNVTTLISAGSTFTPKQLKLEPVAAKLYWSDREGMRVMRADLDGGEIETLYTAAEGTSARRDASNWCVGIAVDVAEGYFYWTQKGADDEQTGSIRRAPLVMAANETSATRSDVEILFDQLAAPVDLDIDAGVLYWTNRGDDTINRGPIAMPAGTTGSTRTDREVLVENVTQAIGIAIDHSRGLVYYTNAVGDVGRAKLDGSDAEVLLSDSGALTGIAVVDLP